MKKEYKTPLTEIVYICADEPILGTDSTGNSGFKDANQSKFDVDETTENIQSGRSLWED